MRLKKLDIFGFKSFAKKQHIHFSDGLTAVVGPNGCGKSNVVDAILWVMGEQNPRHLRGGSMQDIIFCGSEKKTALGFAEVTLTIENTQKNAPLEYNHFAEIEITRRIYRSGESEYEINKQKVRLRDIVEFFLGTGVGTKAYSIIEQGRVNEIISAKPLDRRGIIEEAAGITKYKSKRVAAERRMEQTRHNLARIVDIKNEIDKRLKSLAKDKEKLDRVLALRAHIENLDLHRASIKTLGFLAQARFLHSQLADKQNLVLEKNRDLLIAEDSFGKALASYSEQHELKRVLAELKNEHKNSSDLLARDISHFSQNLEENEVHSQRLLGQAADGEQRIDELTRDLQRLEQEKGGTEELLTEVEQELEKTHALGQEVITRRLHFKNKTEELQTALMKCATDAASAQAKLKALQDQEARRVMERNQLEHDHRVKHDELSESGLKLEAYLSEAETAKAKHQELTTKLEDLKTTMAALERNLLEETTRTKALEHEYIKATSRYDSLQELDKNLEWASPGLERIMASKEKALVSGLLKDVITAVEGQEEVVELGLFHLLDTAIISAKSIASLSQVLKQGRAPLTSLLALDGSEEVGMKNIIGLTPLDKFIIINNDKFIGLKQIFSRIFVAETIEDAIHHWPAAKICHATIITKTKEVLLDDGRALILGEKNNQGILKRKKELSALATQTTSMKEQLAWYEQQIVTRKAELGSHHATKDQFINELRPLSTAMIRIDEAIKQRNLEHARLSKDLAAMEQKIADAHTFSKNIDEESILLKKTWGDCLSQHKSVEEELEALKTDATTAESSYEAHLSHAKAIEVKRASIKERVHAAINAIKQASINHEHLQVQHRNFMEQIEQKKQETLNLKEVLRQSGNKVAALEEEMVKTTAHLTEAEHRLGALQLQKETEEMNLHHIKTALLEGQQEIHGLELAITNLKNDMAMVSERIFERYKKNIHEYLLDFHRMPLNEDEADKEIASLKRSLDSLGFVNENAAAEHDELNKRAHFLGIQVGDLDEALQKLETAIKKINKTTEMRFLEAFHNINRQFTALFPRLFNGGQAYLELSGQNDLQNAGLSIFAKPPGKNVSSLELMSGGEKALTAISLIMAIFMIKPSPFCILDEVDAPLDEANVSRFSQLIKEMSGSTQFIVITHNRKTMESAHQLYGVTMEEAGSSKVVAVRVQEAFEAMRQKPKTNTFNKPTQLFLDDIT